MKAAFIRLCCVAAVFFTAVASAQTFDFSNIQNWVGSGPNQAAFVVAWWDGKSPDPMVWGYRWTGTAPTMLTMMQAISTAVPQLSFTANPEFSQQSDYAVYSIFYDLTGLGGKPTVGLPANLGGKENGFPPNSGDHYREGWVKNGFWGELGSRPTSPFPRRPSRNSRKAFPRCPSPPRAVSCSPLSSSSWPGAGVFRVKPGANREARIYIDRTARRPRDHRHARRHFAPGVVGGESGQRPCHQRQFAHRVTRRWARLFER
jgi:hypothetical protein